MKKFFSSLLVVMLVFIGCSSTPEPTTPKVEMPSWILNPNQDGKNGAVGSAVRTYDQKISTQRKLAITRALDELSLQRGVKVKMSLIKSERYTNDRSDTKMDVDASYQTTGNITAHIEEVYEDKVSGELFIWMVMD